MSDVKAIIADLAERMESTSYKWMSVQRSLLRALIDHVKAVEAERDASDEYVVLQRNALAGAERERDEQSSRIADLERQLAEAMLSAQTIGDELGNQINRLLADRAEARNAALETAAVVASEWRGHPADLPFAGKQVAAAIRAMKHEAGE